jgi:ABC-2 type transport system ATP-binding protein
MRQRAGLAQALIGDPDVVILDEPMSGLDPLGRKEVRDLILRLRDEGKSVFFTSHILQDAEVICDQVAIILAGRVVQQGYLDDLLGQEISGVEIVAEGLSEALFDELSASASRAVVQGGRFLFDFDDEAQADKVISRLREGGGKLRSLVPRRRSLEDLLVAGIAKEGSR